MADSAVPLPFVDVRDPNVSAGDRLPVVLIHGWASASAYWEPLAGKLLDAGRPVWILDLPGYHPGEVLPPDFDWTLDSAAASAAAVLNELGGTRVHLVGHSLGGSVALTLAAEFPHLVATVTLVGMVPAPPNEGFRSMLESQWGQGFIDAGARAKCMEAWYGPLTQADSELLSKGFDVPFSVLGPSGKAAMTGVEPSVPGRVLAPLLVIAGTGDRVRPIDQMAAFASASPRRKLKAISGAGHSVHWEKPQECAEALHDFWKTSWPPPA
ncbi:2-succinyl-6-hydroxy-2,4-cyclohexadiene-1-carboxylate synthase [Paenarthrobacter nitroguajacolicus]|uniref:alpha/beta fold hydrolase n=1 Tax=Paenarthrobacter nitroguajacolicus TaxID=211146 RepID=UPI00286631CB|nr:alpha/beta hydrolase [Paenarthrobacter nitroguajacolicus]MDR6986898.1 2-succinyl-6-hydroxy-2,4-cyclohexadiene-1-carboxylate synthase [Paenarthrobacter nitroguajacolicus]